MPALQPKRALGAVLACPSIIAWDPVPKSFLHHLTSLPPCTATLPPSPRHTHARAHTHSPAAQAALVAAEARSSEATSLERQSQARVTSLQGRLEGANSRCAETEAALVQAQAKCGKEQAKSADLAARVSSLTLELDTVRQAPGNL